MLDDPHDAGLAQFNLSLTIGWINIADTKATIFLTIALALLGASLSDIPAMTRVSNAWANSSSYLCLAALIAVHAAFYITMLLSIWQFVNVVRPRLIPKSEKHSWFFFQSMGLLSPQDFHSFTDELDPPSKLQQLHDQIYNNAVVARQKFAAVAAGINTLVLAALFGILAIAPVLIADALLPKG